MRRTRDTNVCATFGAASVLSPLSIQAFDAAKLEILRRQIAEISLERLTATPEP